MIVDTFKVWLAAIRTTVTNLAGLAIFTVLFVLLLASLYLFVSTREATILQVLITLVFLVLIPAEFFVLQASILTLAHAPGWRPREILLNALKLFVVTIPILVVAYVLWILLNKWQLHYPAPRPPIVFPPAAAKPQPLHWPTLLFTTVRGLLFAVVLPLVTIHLWIQVVAHEVRTLFSGGPVPALKRFGGVFSRALTTTSVLIYALGLILFALIPYALLFFRISPHGTKTDFAVFIFRLVLVFAFILFGWIVTLRALSKAGRSEPGISAAQIGAPAEATA